VFAAGAAVDVEVLTIVRGVLESGHGILGMRKLLPGRVRELL